MGVINHTQCDQTVHFVSAGSAPSSRVPRQRAGPRKRAQRRRWRLQRLSLVGMVRAVAHESVVCEVPTRFVISAYSNRVLVVVTQADNMGTLVSAAAKAAARPVAASADVCDSNAHADPRGVRQPSRCEQRQLYHASTSWPARR